jgi:sialic acid synthase SpsE
LVAARDLKKGNILSERDIGAKRPETGIKVSSYNELIGKRINCDIAENELILNEFIDWGADK